MARMNVAKSISTDLANEELKFFKGRFGSPAHEAILFDYARLIDLLYACERSAELLEDETLTGNSVRVPVKATAGEGVGIVEAPRGTLAHRYALSGTGKLTEMRLIIPTQVNNAAINMSVRAVASKFIRKGEIGEGLLNGVEMLVRAYDPCIKCATRMVNNNLTVEIKDLGGRLIRVLNQCP